MATGFHQLDSATIARLAGVSIRQLNHWDRIGLVSPSAAPARGSGSRRRYSVNDLMMVLAVGTLRDKQMGLSQVREVVTGLRSNGLGIDCAPDTYLVCDANKVIYVGNERSRLATMLQESYVLTLLNVGRLAQQAAELASHHTEPQVSKIAVGRHIYSAVVEAEEDSTSYTARCRAFATCIGQGQSIEDACSDLVQMIEARKEQKNRLDDKKPTTKTATDKRSGAAAWGGDW